WFSLCLALKRRRMSPIGAKRNGRVTTATIPHAAARIAATIATLSRSTRETLTTPEPRLTGVTTSSADARLTLERFRELRARSNGRLDKETAKAIVRELKAVGGDLRAVRRALTGRDSGPALWSVVAELPRDEALRRIDAAL